ncbi:TPA: asparagine synthetase B, partial [Candidatus Sumerlaeota bacterium]|nr:asparagine synthetase B [Candidatus Sumerlaeota bacterium]
YARQIAERFETEHEEFVMKPNAIDVLGRLVWYCDEPMSDSSALATFYVAEITRRHVTVALNGDGGDESFAGYTRYRGMSAVNRYGRIPKFLRQGAAAFLNPLAKALPNFVPLEKAQYLNQFSLYDDARHYAQYLVILREYMKPQLYSDTMRNALGHRDALDYVQREYRRAGLTCEIDRKLNTDVNTYLPGDLLVKMDRMTMAHGLEGRSPFLDHVLMEYAASLPGEVKYANGTLKNILKKALEPVLPRETLYRAKKGFSLPINRWFRENLKDFVRDILLSDRARARGYFNPVYVEKLINDHVAQRQPHHHRLWSLLCFELWCRTFLDRSDLSSGAITL